jgi:hypothetical protein
MLSGLIGSILGFGSSVVPAITEHYKSKRQWEFELKKMEKMAELQVKGYDHEIKRFQEMGLHEEQKALLEHDTAISRGEGFMSALQKSVRPVITTIEITLLREAVNDGMSLTQALNILWDDDTKAIFAAIISFWFGSRAIEKARDR